MVILLNDHSTNHKVCVMSTERMNILSMFVIQNNHAIREINLNKREVLTVVGTGEQGRDRDGNK